MDCAFGCGELVAQTMAGDPEHALVDSGSMARIGKTPQ
jgi:hypothetical protein